MAIATLVFWSGRRRYAHLPPPGRACVRDAFSPAAAATVGRLLAIYVYIAVFWSLYDQTGTAWVLQARHMERDFLGITWLPSQIAAINPLLILLLVPVFNGFSLGAGARQLAFPGLYALAARRVRVTPLHKISLGLFTLAAAFLVPLQVEVWLEQSRNHSSIAGEAGEVGEAGGSAAAAAAAAAVAAATRPPSIGWHVLAYVLLTSAEVMVSITALEFSYTQAPPSLKSVVMALFLISASMGNLLTLLVNAFIQNADGTVWLSNIGYYQFFFLLMLATAVAFVPVACTYRERSFVPRAMEGAPEDGSDEGSEPARTAADRVADTAGGGVACYDGCDAAPASAVPGDAYSAGATAGAGPKVRRSSQPQA